MTKVSIERDYPLEKLIFREDNPRQIKKGQFAKLRKSLNELPDMLDVREIVVDESDNILAGHQRVRALCANGKRTATIKRVEGWNDEQKREFMVKDNAHSGEWDSDVLANQWDIEALGDWGINVPEPKWHAYYGDERERTYRAVNLDKFNSTRSAGKYQMPTIEPCYCVPEELIGFNYAKTSDSYNAGIHFFIDDYQFERVWTTPEKQLSRLYMFKCMLTPDFSLYTDMPLANIIWNVYRSRLIGQIAQDMGLPVIPTLQWADERTFEFVFDGLPMNSVVAVSTVGVMRDEEASSIWRTGMAEALRRLSPSTVLLYGSNNIDFDFGSAVVKIFKPRSML